MKFINVEKLHPHVKKRLVPYCQKFLALHQENIKSILIYGSAADNEYVPRQSNINILIVFEHLYPSVLKNSLKLIKSGNRLKIATPLFLGRWEIKYSLDVFPVEFLEIKENHILIYGEDVFGSLTIDKENMRIYCEHDFKSKFMRLRQLYLQKGLNRRKIIEVMVGSITLFITSFRNMLRLQSKIPPVLKEDILVAIASSYDIDLDVFLKVLHHKRGLKKISPKKAEELWPIYLDELNQLVLAMDRMK